MCDARIAELELRLDRAEAERSKADARVEALEARLAASLTRIQDLEERLRQNSSNSSRPPSADPPSKPKAKKKRRSGRKRGAQPGHEAQFRPLVPVEQVDKLEHVHPKTCTACGGRNLEDSGSIPDRHQVTEIPEPKATVTETQLHSAVCLDCGATVRAELPPGVPSGSFGPRLLGLVALLTGAYRLSKRKVVTLMQDLFHIEMALGSVSASEQFVSEALAEPVREAQSYVQEQPVANADETSWWQTNKKTWLWVLVTPLVTVFLIHLRRGHVAARALLGKFHGILCTDRWVGYSFWPLGMRQFCWAHLKRAFTAMAETRGKARQIGQALLAEQERLFVWWHKLREGKITRLMFRGYVAPLRKRVEELLAQGAACRHKKSAGLCAELLKGFEALWTFVEVEGVEPTNNAAERALRYAVIWRKVSFGTNSERGSRFVERILTATTTLWQQGRDILAYLTSACEAAMRGEPSPSLLPKADDTVQVMLRA